MLPLCGQANKGASLSCLAEGVHVVEDRAVLSHTEALHLTQELVLQRSMLFMHSGLTCSGFPAGSCTPAAAQTLLYPWSLAQSTLHLARSKVSRQIGSWAAVTSDCQCSRQLMTATPALSSVLQGCQSLLGPWICAWPVQLPQRCHAAAFKA